MLGEHVGKALAGCEWVGVPFAGGMAELAHIKARTMLVSDLHRHVINLATCVAHPDLKAKIVERCDATLFHPDALALAQEKCMAYEHQGIERPDVQAAYYYFVCVWMARNATAGTDGEFRAGLSLRWNAGGGDSAVRFRNATESLADWLPILRRCTFCTDDVFDFLNKVHDEPKHGLYLDPPFPGPGDKYRHKFGETLHRKLAARLAEFNVCRVVCRFYDVPLIRELYPEPAWTWQSLSGRKQTNDAAPEVLIVRN
jgi:hypothetical protein